MLQASRRVQKILLLFVVALFSTVAALAQTTYGTVRGLVKDPQGAVLVGAEVTLTNEGTKVARKTKTSASGEYTFSAVEPGAYDVAVKLTGFKETEEKGVTVNTGTASTADLALSVGGSTETVEVSTTEPLIDTANANGGQAFDSTQLQELPNLGRNPFVFEKMDTAVTPVGDPRYVRAEDQTGQSTVSVSGAPIGANNYAVDGIPISQSNGGVTFIPSLEAVSDVKVQANTYDAEVGRTGGGMFNTTLKSGTSDYHGALYGVTRQTPWSANSWVNNHTPYFVNGVQISPTTTPRPDVTTYLYAAAFGGKIPFSDKFKYTKNTFFWVTEEGYRQAQPLPGSGQILVPNPAERTGDFSALLTAGVQLYDPTTPVGSTGRTPIAGNIIKPSYINQIGQAIANVYPACNYSCSSAVGTAPAPAAGTTAGANDYAVDDFKTRSDMYSGKLDHQFFNWWTSTLSYVHLATQEPTGSFIKTVDNSDGILHRFNDATAWNNVFQLNSSTILTAGYGFNRYYSHQVPYSFSASPGGFNQATGFNGAGFSPAFVSLVQSKTFPTISVSGIGTAAAQSLASLGTSDGGPTIQSSRNVVIGLSKTIGKQDIKAGYVYRHMSNFQQPLGSSGAYAFDGQYTTKDGKVANGVGTSTTPANGGSGLADLLLGNPGSSSGAPETISEVSPLAGNFNQIINYHALFVQDNFRVSSKLTVNAGIRYEYEPGQKEAHNQYVVAFDPNVAYTFPCAVAPCANAHGGLDFASGGGYPYPRRSTAFSKYKFSPRIGAAYEIRKGTVVRGGFGIFYSPVALVLDTTGYTQSTTTASTGSTAGVTTVGTAAPLGTPFSAGVLTPSGNTLGALTGVGGTVSAQDSNRKYPLVEQYSFNVQQQLPFGVSLEVGYIGAHSKYLPQNVSVNQVADGTMGSILAAAKLPGAAAFPGTKVANPYYAPTITSPTGATYPAAGNIASSTVYQTQLLLPFPQYTGNGVTEIQSVGYSLYNAMSVKIQKRYRGLTTLIGYTWSSNWDNFYGAASAYSSSLNSTSGPQDNYNLRGEYARAVNNIPNRLTTSITYELPVGRGKRFGGNMPKLLDYVVGGWELNDVSIIQNGSPLSFTQTNLNTTLGGVVGFGGNNMRPTVTGNACYHGAPESRLGAYFNTAAFSATPAFTYTSTARTLACQGPGYANSDVSIDKTISIKDKVKVQFRIEALNATNTPEFSNPSTTVAVTQTSLAAAPSLPTSQGSLGAVTGTVGFNRIIQMGGRITF